MAEKVRAAVQTGPRRIEMREVRPADDQCRRRAAARRGEWHSAAATSRSSPVTSATRTAPRSPFPATSRWASSRRSANSPPSGGACRSATASALEVIVPCRRSCNDCLTGRYQACKFCKHGHGVTATSTSRPTCGAGSPSGCTFSPTSVMHRVSNDLTPEVAAMYNPLGAGVRWAAQLGEIGLGDTVVILGHRAARHLRRRRREGRRCTAIITGLETDGHKLELAREFCCSPHGSHRRRHGRPRHRRRREADHER